MFEKPEDIRKFILVGDDTITLESQMDLTHTRLDEIATEANYECRSYSGRGMYGKQCVAIVSDDPLLKMAAMLVSCCNDTEEAAELLRTAHTDSMGKGIVLYWPTVNYR